MSGDYKVLVHKACVELLIGIACWIGNYNDISITSISVIRKEIYYEVWKSIFSILQIKINSNVVTEHSDKNHINDMNSQKLYTSVLLECLNYVCDKNLVSNAIQLVNILPNNVECKLFMPVLKRFRH